MKENIVEVQTPVAHQNSRNGVCIKETKYSDAEQLQIRIKELERLLEESEAKQISVFNHDTNPQFQQVLQITRF